MILQMLAEIKNDQKELAKNQEKMLKDQEKLFLNQEKMYVSQEDLSNKVTKIELHLENVTDKNIKLLAEQYKDNYEQIKDNANKRPASFDVDILKVVMSTVEV